jgi:hypothetical protein
MRAQQLGVFGSVVSEPQRRISRALRSDQSYDFQSLYKLVPEQPFRPSLKARHSGNADHLAVWALRRLRGTMGDRSATLVRARQPIDPL